MASTNERILALFGTQGLAKTVDIVIAESGNLIQNSKSVKTKVARLKANHTKLKEGAARNAAGKAALALFLSQPLELPQLNPSKAWRK